MSLFCCSVWPFSTPLLWFLHCCLSMTARHPSPIRSFSHCLSPSFQPFKHSSTTGDQPRTSYRQSHCFLSATWDTFTWVEPPAAGQKAIRENQLMWDSNCERWRAQSPAPNFARRSRQIRQKWMKDVVYIWHQQKPSSPDDLHWVVLNSPCSVLLLVSRTIGFDFAQCGVV